MNFDRILKLLRDPHDFTIDELRTARLIAADIIESLPQQVAPMERVALDDGDVLVVHVPDHLSEDRMKAIKRYIELIPPFAGHECVIIGGGMRLSVLSPPSVRVDEAAKWLPLCPCRAGEPCQCHGRGSSSGYRCRREGGATWKCGACNETGALPDGRECPTCEGKGFYSDADRLRNAAL